MRLAYATTIGNTTNLSVEKGKTSVKDIPTTEGEIVWLGTNSKTVPSHALLLFFDLHLKLHRASALAVMVCAAVLFVNKLYIWSFTALIISLGFWGMVTTIHLEKKQRVGLMKNERNI